MAYTVPETLASLDSRVMPGERKVFVALRDHLPEDYIVYYDIPVDGRHPDFIIVGPDLGLVVLEVKDWRLKNILEVRADQIRLRQAEGELKVLNPVRQVRDYLLCLDAEHVLILNAHELDGLPTQEEARRLLYIAMTRARDELCISSARPSRVMDELARAVTSAAA